MLLLETKLVLSCGKWKQNIIPILLIAKVMQNVQLKETGSVRRWIHYIQGKSTPRSYMWIPYLSVKGDFSLIRSKG